MASSSHQSQHDEKLTDEQIRRLVDAIHESIFTPPLQVGYEFSPIKPAGSDNFLPDDVDRLKHEVPDFLEKLERDVGWCIQMLKSLKSLSISSQMQPPPKLKALIDAMKLDSPEYVLQELCVRGLEIMEAAASLSSLQSFTVRPLIQEHDAAHLDRFVAALDKNCIGNNIWHLGIFGYIHTSEEGNLLGFIYTKDFWKDAFRKLCTDSRLKALTIVSEVLSDLFMEVMVEEGLPRRLQHLMLYLSSRGSQDFSRKLGRALEKTEWDPECSLATLSSLHVYSDWDDPLESAKEVLLCIGYGISNLCFEDLTAQQLRLGWESRMLQFFDFSAEVLEQLLEQLTMPGSNLRHLMICKLFFLSRKNQVKLVNFLDRHVECPLETIEGLQWADQSLKMNCMEIMKRNKVYRDGGLLTKQMPPSTAKLFICGDSGVGKSTLRKNLTRSIFIPSCLQSSTSTVGIRLAALKFEEKTLVLCDLAGQPEFHTLHHYFVRGSDKDLFLLVCKAPSATEDPDSLENQLRYWLRFIVAHRSLSDIKPRVLIFLNNFPDSDQNQNPLLRCEHVIQHYSHQVNFENEGGSRVHNDNAKSFRGVQALKPTLEAALNCLINSRPNVPELCKQIIQRMNDKPRPRIISMADFKSSYGMKKLHHRHFRACVTYLHDTGEVVYLDSDEAETNDESHQYIIVDVQWFLRDLIGQFLPRLPRHGAKEHTNLGASQPLSALKAIIAKKCDEKHIEYAKKCDEKHIEYVLRCLDRLGITLSLKDAKGDTHVKILPLLPDAAVSWSKENALESNSSSSSDTYCFWGRRFDCKDSGRTLLPFGIFNMLQVQLAGKFSKNEVGKGWFYLIENRVHIIINIGGTSGKWYDKHWVDVLVRIPVHPDGYFLEEGEKLFHNVKTCLHSICVAVNWGCPALELEEKVISPRCVERGPGADFRNVDELINIVNKIKEKGMLYYYTWQFEGETTEAFQLLFPREVDTLFNDQQRILDDIHLEVKDCLNPESTAEQRMSMDSMEATTIEDENLTYEGRVIIKRLKSHVSKEVKASEERLTNEIHKLGEVVKKQMHIIEVQVTSILSKLQLHLDFEAPKYPFLTDENNFLQKFSALTFGLTSRLHFLCEHEQGCHIVEGQTGREIKISPEWFKKVAPVLIPTLRVLVFTLKIVAVAGLGVLIPTPESAFPGGLKDKTIDAVCEEVFKIMDKRIPLERGRGPVIPASATAASGSGSKEKITDSVYEQALKDVDKSRFPSRNDLEGFRESLKDFLDVKTMRKEFGLYPCMRNGKHAWVCQKHKEPGSSS